MRDITTLAEIQEVLTGKKIVKVVREHGKLQLSDPYCYSWVLNHVLDDGTVFSVAWTGYSPGYSEYTPSEHGCIQFSFWTKEEAEKWLKS